MKNKPVKWLKEIRISANLSTYAVAERAGISQSHYSMIENGQRSASVSVAKRIARVLGFDWSKFYDAA